MSTILANVPVAFSKVISYKASRKLAPSSSTEVHVYLGGSQRDDSKDRRGEEPGGALEGLGGHRSCCKEGVSLSLCESVRVSE